MTVIFGHARAALHWTTPACRGDGWYGTWHTATHQPDAACPDRLSSRVSSSMIPHRDNQTI